MKRVVIVGGGITGLATAHALEKSKSHVEALVFEASARLGGNIQTVTHNGFIIDAGPDSWVASKPYATRLVREMGMSGELMGTRADKRRVYILFKKRLHPMPEGLVLGIPTEWRPFAETELLGLDAKLRAGLEPVIPRKTFGEDDDESIASFVSRRLGSEISERIVGPLLGGIFAGDPEALSVRACVPQLVDAEAKYGSLVRAMRAQRRARLQQTTPGGDEPSAFLSLKRGLGDLVVNVAHRLRDANVQKSCPVKRVARLPAGDARGRWAVETHGTTHYADDVALTIPAHVATRLLRDVDPEMADICGTFPYASTATAFLAFRASEVRHPLDAFGFLVPRSENRPILAATFVSSKWDNRAPAGQVLLRLFFGGAAGEHVLGYDDDTLVRIAREEVRELLGIDAEPVFAKVFRFDRASPLPPVGHVMRVKRLFARARSHPGLHLGGNGYLGSGIPDAIKQGEDIAQAILGTDRITDAETRPSLPA